MKKKFILMFLILNLNSFTKETLLKKIEKKIHHFTTSGLISLAKLKNKMSGYVPFYKNKFNKRLFLLILNRDESYMVISYDLEEIKRNNGRIINSKLIRDITLQTYNCIKKQSLFINSQYNQDKYQFNINPNEVITYDSVDLLKSKITIEGYMITQSMLDWILYNTDYLRDNY